MNSYLRTVTARAFAGVLAATMALPAVAAPLMRYGYEVLEQLPHPRENFVQGLQILGDTLYVSTGQYGESRLLAYEFPAMKLKQEHALPPALFGEGVTRLEDRIYQLTWRAGQLIEYDAESFKPLATHRISTQGWGLTHNGSELIYSDGSHQLYFLNTDDMRVKRTLAVTLGARPLPRLNELEWIEGEIWANVWQANQLVRIDPETGAVLGIVDLRGLLDPEDREPGTDVLNGIAWDADNRALWVTGKRWPWLYRLKLRAMPAPGGP
ncbi:glutaminyl-peptide cyclotransferase [Congregibacter litoralis]|uniref:Glutamine cyclotransferase n=1 Tax=Congregibacter litoralis KT71 TaxID=314285 RepID=A4ACD4_9GAMM|nr:glutaminyl-peptide cyclotransferase [Congregibacter litoralis]EAQ96362.1 Glutamine cyclotransferase [Congregibacter litoralis KT71]